MGLFIEKKENNQSDCLVFYWAPVCHLHLFLSPEIETKQQQKKVFFTQIHLLSIACLISYFCCNLFDLLNMNCISWSLAGENKNVSSSERIKCVINSVNETAPCIFQIFKKRLDVE